MTHNCNNPWADSSLVDKEGNNPVHNGLTSFGKVSEGEVRSRFEKIELITSSGPRIKFPKQKKTFFRNKLNQKKTKSYFLKKIKLKNI